MFSSPAPRATPRRRARDSVSISRSNRALSSYVDSDAGSVSGAGSIATSTSRHNLTLIHAHAPLTPSIRSGRLNVLRRGGGGGSPTSSAGETIRTLRVDGDGLDQAIWARDERLCISSAGRLPREVQSVVKRAGKLLYPQSHCGVAVVPARRDNAVTFDDDRRRCLEPRCWPCRPVIRLRLALRTRRLHSVELPESVSLHH